MSKPKDASDAPVSALRATGQYLLQLLVGVDMSAQEYSEKLLLVTEQLEAIYWLGYNAAAARDVFRRATLRPPKPPEGWGPEVDFGDIKDGD